MASTIRLPKSVANAIVMERDTTAEYAVTESGKDASVEFSVTDTFIFYCFEAAFEIGHEDDDTIVRLVIQDKTSEIFYAADYFDGAFDLFPVIEAFSSDFVTFNEIEMVEEKIVVIKKSYFIL